MDPNARNTELLKEHFLQEMNTFIKNIKRFNQDLNNPDVFFECLALLHRIKVMFENASLKPFAELFSAMEHVFRCLKLKKVSWTPKLYKLFVETSEYLSRIAEHSYFKGGSQDLADYLNSFKSYQKPLWD